MPPGRTLPATVAVASFGIHRAGVAMARGRAAGVAGGTGTFRATGRDGGTVALGSAFARFLAAFLRRPASTKNPSTASSTGTAAPPLPPLLPPA